MVSNQDILNELMNYVDGLSHIRSDEVPDIETILHPLCEGHFSRESDPALAEIYDRVFTLEDSARKNLRKDVEEKFAQCEDTFADAPEEDREYLRLFAFLCSLSFDVYVKKEMVNQIAGILREEGVPSAQGAHEQVPGEK